MKLRKLKKKNARNTERTWQLKQDCQSKLEMSSVGVHADTQRRAQEQKKFYGNKTSTSC